MWSRKLLELSERTRFPRCTLNGLGDVNNGLGDVKNGLGDVKNASRRRMNTWKKLKNINVMTLFRSKCHAPTMVYDLNIFFKHVLCMPVLKFFICYLQTYSW